MQKEENTGAGSVPSGIIQTARITGSRHNGHTGEGQSPALSVAEAPKPFFQSLWRTRTMSQRRALAVSRAIKMEQVCTLLHHTLAIAVPTTPTGPMLKCSQELPCGPVGTAPKSPTCPQGLAMGRRYESPGLAQSLHFHPSTMTAYLPSRLLLGWLGMVYLLRSCGQHSWA